MVHVGLLSLLGLTSMLLPGAEAGCSSSSSQIECHTGGKCISHSSLCNARKDCNDGSDEDPYFCESWTTSRQHCGTENTYCERQGCYSISYGCSLNSCTPAFNSRMCEMVRGGKLILPKTGMNLTSEAVAVLTTAVNTSLKNKKQECPMLYTQVGHLCLALFSPAKVPWPEARQFCRSIYGDLVKFDNLAEFGDVLQYMRSSRLTTDFWVGGRFDLDTNAWSWTVDESLMPLGSPYWAVWHMSSCKARPPPHTDPFSDPSVALPGAPCYSYTQAPTNRLEGWCSALTYEHYYYLSDQSCQEERSPLCMLEADVDNDHPDE